MTFEVSIKVSCTAEDKKGAIAEVVKAHNIKATDIYHVSTIFPKIEHESMEEEVAAYGGTCLHRGNASMFPKHPKYQGANWRYRKMLSSTWVPVQEMMEKNVSELLHDQVAEVWLINDKLGNQGRYVWVKSIQETNY